MRKFSFKRVGLVVFLVAFGVGAQEDVKAERPWFCDLVPFACPAIVNSGSGGGTEPPKPPSNER